MKEKIKGWIVICDNKDRIKTVPVAAGFFLIEDDAIDLRDKMEVKRAKDPQTFKYPYKVINATLVVGE